MLTPIDIQKREFKTALNGYNKKEVKEFMFLIAEALESNISEIEELKYKISQEQIELQKYRNIESTLSETLVFAKQTSEEMIAQARKKEELILRDAEQQGNEKLWQKQTELVQLEKRFDELNLRYETFKMKLTNYLNLQLDLLREDSPKAEIKQVGDENRAKVWKPANPPVIEEKNGEEDDEELPSLEKMTTSNAFYID